MSGTEWLLSLLGLHYPQHTISNGAVTDLRRVNAAARQQASVNARVTRSVLATLERQAQDPRPEALFETIERLPRSSTHDTITAMLGRMK